MTFVAVERPRALSGVQVATSFVQFDRPSELIGMTADRKLCGQPWLPTHRETCQDIRLR
jgi:hypothetical protein